MNATAPLWRYRLIVAYDGSAFAGWQIQPGVETIQERLELALETICGERPKVHGSGRTDQGVHAVGQVAHFDLTRAIIPARLLISLNAVLPSEIRVMSLRPARPDFHARRSATSKEYRYCIWNGEVLPPFVRHYRAHVRAPLDVRTMQQAAALLEGRHDFTAFTANPNREVESNVRSVTRLKVSRRGPDITIVARGEGFLYRMVRSLAGFLIRVGQGELPPAAAREILDSRVRTARVPTAPAAGLFLWKVWYGSGTLRAHEHPDPALPVGRRHGKS